MALTTSSDGGEVGHRSRIGFIGLGAMGRPMVNGLIAAGFPVFVHDAVPEAIGRLVEDGAESAGSAREVAERCELVFTMLPRADDVLEAVLGPDGVVAGIRPGSALIDTSTIDVGTVRSLAAPLVERGATMLDGGVSGSPSMAWQRQVTLMVGGDEEAFGRFRSAFEAIAETIIYAGALGSAKTMKLANNLVAAITTAALAEAFTLISRSGTDPVLAKQAMERSWASNALLSLRPPLPGLVEGSPADRGYDGEFDIDYMAKDLAAVLESARECGAVLMTTALVRQLFVAAGTRGDGRLDVSALIRTTEGFSRPVD